MFSGCPNVCISDFTNVKSINSDAFNGSGTGHGMLKIVLPNPIPDGYAKNCFKNYAINCIESITYLGGGTIDDDTLANLGFTYSNPTVIEVVTE